MQLRNNGCATGNGGTAMAVLREFSQLSDTWKRAASNNQNSAFSCHTLYGGEACESHGMRALRSQSHVDHRQCISNNIECNAQVQSALLDTGADISLFKTQAESAMSDKRLSATRIQVADSNFMQGHVDGKLHMCILNAQQGDQHGMVFTHQVTTADNLSHDLLSIDDMYVKGGFSILLRNPNFESGIPEIFKPATNDQPAISIPLRYDYAKGGFWLDYVLEEDGAQHGHLLRDQQCTRALSASMQSEREVDWDEICQVIDQAYANHNVTEVVSHQEVAAEFKCNHHCCNCRAFTGTITDSEPQRCNIRGVKAGLRNRKKQLPAMEFHDDHGHLGCTGKSCIICRLAAGSARRIYSAIDKHTETRRAHTWWMDILTWQHRSSYGSKYQIVLRDYATKTFRSLYLYKRSGAITAIKAWITSIRADPSFHGLEYLPVTQIRTDGAGEWGWTNEAWRQLEKDLSFETVYSCPDRKEEAANAERAVGIMEVTVKAILLQRGLHHSWWQDCADAACFLLNRIPELDFGPTMPSDGDQQRPEEALTGGRISRRQLDRELSYYLAPGTPALVHDPSVKGSQFVNKSTWKVARGMYREQVVFWSPYNDAISRSKSYTAFKMQRGISYEQWLPGLKPRQPSKRQMALPEDCETGADYVITFPTLPTEHIPTLHKFCDSTSQKAATSKHFAGAEAQFGGSTGNFDTPIDYETGQQLLAAAEANLTESDSAEALPSDTDTTTVHVETDSKMQKLWDAADAEKVKHRQHTARSNDRFVRVCKEKLSLPHQQHTLYKKWLMEIGRMPNGSKIQESDLSFERGTTLKPGLIMHYPSGSKWRQLTNEQFTSDAEMEAKSKRLCRIASEQVLAEVKAQTTYTRATGRIHFAKATTDVHVWQDRSWRAMAVKVKRQKAIAQGHQADPRSTKEALERDPHGWNLSIHEEVDGLAAMGVVDNNEDGNGFTKAELKAEGIDLDIKPAVPLGLYHTTKFDHSTGDIDKLKTRAAIQGHKGNMQRGIHFNETFTACPREDTARILSALMCLFNLCRMTCDIVKAYCWAPIPKEAQKALRYPRGLKRRCPITGEEKYAILRKNLYGDPGAGRAWGLLRDAEFMAMFNGNGWTCIKTEMDPCLFFFKLEIKGRPTQFAWALVHTDDVDTVGTTTEICEAIFAALHNKWEIKITDPTTMLGVNRETTRDADDKVVSVEHTMQAYIKGMAEAFREYLPKKTVSTIFPEGVSLSKFNKPDEAEIKDHLGMGYMRAVGMALWAIRHIFPEGKFGISQACSVMAIPGAVAFKAVMHMIAYMEQHSAKGVKFSADGNRIPVCTSDASNKPDVFDGKCYAGFTFHWMNGPLATKSFKLKHKGLSSEHNEYMGVTAAIRVAIWLRQLFCEINLDEFVAEPTIIYGDNIQANRLCKEHFVTTGNQHIYQPYHFNREAVEMGIVAIHWVSTKLNLADIMTKAVPATVLNDLVDLLCGYGNIQQLTDLIESSPRLHTEDCRKLEGVSRKSTKK